MLAMGGGMMLTAVTSHMSANIAAIPLLWLPPLALYLLTFILAFQGAWVPIRQSMLRLVLVAVASLAYVLRDIRAQLPIAVSVPLFLDCVICDLLFSPRRTLCAAAGYDGHDQVLPGGSGGECCGNIAGRGSRSPGTAGEL